MRASSPDPLVSIILPTYNRAKFLPQAFASIRGQTLGDWELIVVDDGSTDDTRSVVEQLGAGMSRPLRYVYQENKGPHAARNTGLDHVTGKYIAFYDSDDIWLPHHIADCVAALEAHQDVDWTYGSSRIVDYATGGELAANTFYVNGKPRPLLKLRCRQEGRLRIITDSRAISCTITHGLFCGLQVSVMRREVFRHLRLPPFRIGEDQVFTVLALKAGYRLGYLEDVHVLYRVHEDNISGACNVGTLDRRVQSLETLACGLASLRDQVPLTPAERRALRRRLSQIYFWSLGYALLWQHGRRGEALAMFRRGIRQWPWDLRYWKTYLLALARYGRGRNWGG
jgi:glycosyltransferase involved in cell wall biosynthesis